ncbi:MAG: asparagine synthase (glutamine-hydrolyzing) [Oscillospiraceae bacterium]|nr:asparagine synthase (glutamine-hydrolyzing) [Oscillospiraceae bacterium]
MCGIAGEINFKNEINEQILREMSICLTPRGPDADGFYKDEHVCLAHRRLIVIDPENGKQPMTAGNYTLVYNGELYNTDELRAGLVGKGYQFNGHSDTEVVLKSFIEYGERCVEMFNGIFAFAVWDRKEQRLFMARDRIGVKPLFYAETDGGIVFASEIKALFKHPAVKPVITREGAAQIMLIGPARIVGDGVFRDIRDLPAAYCAWFDSGGLKVKPYWKLSAKPHEENFEESARHVRELIFDAVKRQLVSDVGICTFLSGGLDSSVISAIAAKEFEKRGEKLHTFSIDYVHNHENFRASEFQPDEDAPYVRRMAEFIGSEHINVELDTPQLADALEDSTFARDLPGMADVDSSLFLFCREIKKHFSVAVSGECADEIFGGYPWYHKPEVLHYDGFPWATSVPERGALMKDPLSPGDAEAFVRHAYNDCLAGVDYLDGEDASQRRSREMFILNLKYFMATLLDRKDRMSMAHGLEVRVPFCDYRLVEYAYNIPREFRDYRDREKGIVRYAMTGVLPEDVLWRKKSPYPKTHNPNYMRLLSDRLREVLKADDCRLVEIANADRLRELLDTDGASFTKNWYGQLMTVPQIYAYFLQIESWMRRYDVTVSE